MPAPALAPIFQGPGAASGAKNRPSKAAPATKTGVVIDPPPADHQAVRADHRGGCLGPIKRPGAGCCEADWCLWALRALCSDLLARLSALANNNVLYPSIDQAAGTVSTAGMAAIPSDMPGIPQVVAFSGIFYFAMCLISMTSTRSAYQSRLKSKSLAVLRPLVDRYLSHHPNTPLILASRACEEVEADMPPHMEDLARQEVHIPLTGNLAIYAPPDYLPKVTNQNLWYSDLDRLYRLTSESAVKDEWSKASDLRHVATDLVNSRSSISSSSSSSSRSIQQQQLQPAEPAKEPTGRVCQGWCHESQQDHKVARYQVPE